jgi:hypothetical protein
MEEIRTPGSFLAQRHGMHHKRNPAHPNALQRPQYRYRITPWRPPCRTTAAVRHQWHRHRLTGVGMPADRIGRRSSIPAADLLFVTTSICGAMPPFSWNLAM